MCKCTYNAVYSGGSWNCDYNDCRWTYDIIGSPTKSCLINTVYQTGGHFCDATGNTCSDSVTRCKSDSCPSESGFNGANCYLRTGCGTACAHWPEEAGITLKWDASAMQCIQCSGYEEDRKWGDTSGIYAACNNDSVDITNNCESACGAPSDLDEADRTYCRVKNLNCPSSVNAGAAFTINYEISGTGGSYPYEVVTIERDATQETCLAYNEAVCTWNSKSWNLTAPSTGGSYTYRAKCYGDDISPWACGEDDGYVKSCTITVKKSLGESCSSGPECSSGNCVDNVCCNTSCPGVCQACNVSGYVGTCTTYPDGTDCEGSGVAPDRCCSGVCDNNGESGSGYTTDCRSGPSCVASGDWGYSTANGGSACGSYIDYCYNTSTCDSHKHKYFCSSGYCSGTPYVDDADSSAASCNGQFCDTTDHCVGSTYYTAKICTATEGICSDWGDIGCCQGSYCSAGQYCRESDHQCQALPGCTQRNEAGFGYSNICSGADTNCGCSSCINCDASGTGAGRTGDGCSGDSYINYYCSGTSCTYSSDACSDCSCSCGGYNTVESTAYGNCSDGKDNDCDTFTDQLDPDCGCAPPVSGNWEIPAGVICILTNQNYTLNGNIIIRGTLDLRGTSNLTFSGSPRYIYIYSNGNLYTKNTAGFNK